MFDPHLTIGQRIKNEDLQLIFKCANSGGMRRSKATNTLVLITDRTKGFYYDKWKNGVLHYTGMGLYGDQSLSYKQNYTLAKSKMFGIDVHLFEVRDPHEYIYCGIVELVDKPYQDTQPDASGYNRKVWIFPIRPVQNIYIWSFDEDLLLCKAYLSFCDGTEFVGEYQIVMNSIRQMFADIPSDAIERRLKEVQSIASPDNNVDMQLLEAYVQALKDKIAELKKTNS